MNETIPANMMPMDQCNAFDHSGFQGLKLQPNEEFILNKAKRRRVLAITKPDIHGLVKVAPVYTLKEYHAGKYDIDKLVKNELPGIIYLEETDINSESFISLMESFPVYKNILEPIRVGRNEDGIELLDDNLVVMFDLYSTSE